MNLFKAKIRDTVRNLLYYFPNEGRSIKRVYWEAISIKRKKCMKLRKYLSSWRQPDPDAVFWIDPNRIIFHTNLANGCSDFADRVFHQIKDKGKVIGGNWDQSSYKFSDLEIFKAISNRIKYGAEWEQSVFFRSTLEKIKKGSELWGCRDYNTLRHRCEVIGELIDSVKQYQVLSQPHLQEIVFKNNSSPLQDEIYVNIGRNGQYLFQDGRHRLAIAQILGVQRIPVKVLVRHPIWQELREQLLNMAEKQRGATSRPGFLYQPALHPDFMDIPAAHSCLDRWEAIRQAIEIPSGKVLDIGANLGFFCHKFEKEGYDCIAAEHLPEIVEVADKIRIAEDRKFKIIEGDVLASDFFSRCGTTRFDILIALNIFHHFLKKKILLKNLRGF